MKKIFILSLILLSLVVLVACANNDTPVQTEPVGTTAVTTTKTAETEQVFKLSEFTLIYSEKASTRVEIAASNIASLSKELSGKKLSMRVDKMARGENAKEIVIGKTTRAESSVTDTLGDDEYLIRSEKGIIVITAKSDDLICAAVTDFIAYLKNLYNEMGENAMIGNFEIRASGAELDVTDFAVIYPDTASASVRTMAKSIALMIEKSNGKPAVIAALSSAEEDTRYKNAIIIGRAGKTGEELCSETADLTYKVRQYSENGGVKIYLCGKDDVNLIRAVHYFYEKVYREGKFSVPKNMNVTVSAFFQRDPCILLYGDKYYLYANGGNGFSVRTSEDLLEWTSTKMIFTADGSDAIGDFWAPECHYYNGKFYLMATYKSSRNNHRGVAVLRSDTPDGTFEIISKNSPDATEKGHITAFDWDAIDGTLYVDKNGNPYMVFVHEWTSTDDGIGRMCYAPLSEDLSYFTSEPVEIFRADDPVWTDQQVTDGPWLYRCEDGSLLMIWSNFGAHGYAVTIAKSSNGEIDGEWIQSEAPMFTGDDTNVFSVIEGGHGMILRSKEGRIYMVIHAPNSGTPATTYVPLFEKDGMLYVDVAENR